MEMSELIESDQELNHADNDSNNSDYHEEDSFLDSDEELEVKKAMKKNAVKINNSFTGPYPLDPTDFGHNDKGPNPQFAHLNEVQFEDI